MGDEIEVKCLIREENRTFAKSTFYNYFNSVWDLKKQIYQRGHLIDQGYLPLEKGILLADNLDIIFDFSPKEARLRKTNGKFYFTLKGTGRTSRPEKEVIIDENIFYDNWNLTEGKRIKKIRMEHPFLEYIAEFDLYLDRKLITSEVEVPTLQIAKSLPLLGKEISEDTRYKNKNLAR